jgi:hypothetical protein
MKKRTQQDFLLGLAAILFVALFVASVVFLYPAVRRGGRMITIHFEHEAGMAPLKEGSAVLLSDSIDVGQVASVRIAQIPQPGEPKAPRQTVFVVRAEIDGDVPLYGNARITTNQPAVGGAGYVSILNVGTPDQPLVGPIEGLPPQSLAAAISTMSRMLLGPGGLIENLNTAVDPTAEQSIVRKLLVSLNDVNAMTAALRAEMNAQDQQAFLAKIHRILDDFNATTRELRRQFATEDSAALLPRVQLALAHLDESLVEVAALVKENRPLVHSTLVSVENTARTVDADLLARVRDELDAGNPTSMLGQLHESMARVNDALLNVQEIARGSQSIVALSQPHIEQTLQNFREMSDRLRQASQEVLLNPSKLIWGPSRGREEQLVVFQAASNFAEAAGQLDTAAGRLQAVLRNNGRLSPAEHEELQAIYDQVQASFQRFGRAEEVLWQQLKK